MKLLRRPSSRKSKRSDLKEDHAPPPPPPALSSLASSSDLGNTSTSELPLPTPAIPAEIISRPSSSASANKPLPGVPLSTSSPNLAVKQSPTIRKLALSSAASTGAAQSLATPLPPSAPYLQPASNSSENWTGPEDADGAYIRKTYAHFDESGIKGDGLVEGKEWTRERGAKAAWDSSESAPPSRSTKLSMQLKNGQNSSTKASVKNGRLATSSPSDLNLPTSPTSMELLDSPKDERRSLSPSKAGGLGEESIGASSSSLGSRSMESASGVPNGETQVVAIDDDTALEADRREMIKNIDRYGFFSKDGQSTRSRITVLPATSMQSIPKRRGSRQGIKSRKEGRSSDVAPSPSLSTEDAYLSSTDQQLAHKNALQFVMQSRESNEMKLREREAVRVAKWDRMLEVKKTDQGVSFYGLVSGVIRTKKFRKRIYKGIPDRWRSAVWWAILLEQSKKPAILGEAEIDYKRLIDLPSSHDVQIDLDVPRTISGHVLFHTRYGQGQRSLFHVLHAFSLLCPQCGYCQGMGPIVATLLVYFTPEKSYAIMLELHRRSLYGLHDTFSPGFPGLVENFYVQRKLCEKLCPDLITSLESDGVVISSYATKWYITLYTNVLPFSTQLRLWDCFLLQGKDLLVVIAVAILWSLRDQLLGGGFEMAMKSLTREFIPVDDDAFLNWIFQIMERDDNRKRMREARYEYRRMVKEGMEPVL